MRGCWAFSSGGNSNCPTRAPTQLLQLAKPIGVHATYLVRDGLVLELIDYSKREVHAGPERVMDQAGTDASVVVGVQSRPTCWRWSTASGDLWSKETVTEQFAMIRDPDGQLIELLPDSWLAALPPRP